MTTTVQKIVEQIKSLPENEFEEFLSWLVDYELKHSDLWDDELEKDSLDGGKLDSVLRRARKDISEGRIKPLDEVINDS
jgi:hypothetical protein